MQHSNTAGCILLKFYIKPQHTANVYNLLYVVSYRNSTSNHNMSHWRATSQGVVSYRNSTSNHNAGTTTPNSALLYLIEILHQTTTGKCIECRQKKLYLIEILHQTTTVTPAAVLGSSLYLIEILHQTTTVLSDISLEDMLYLIEILHQTTTIHAICRIKKSCILSKFYIKPQLFVR